MMKYLVKKGIHEAVAMYFRNPCLAAYDEWPDGALSMYHLRNHGEGVNSYMKENLGLEIHIIGKRMKNIDIHVTECCVVLLAAALTRLQRGIIENLSSIAYLT